MTKRILSAAMAAAMLVSLAACSGNTASSTAPAASSAAPAASSTAPAASSAAPVETPAEPSELSYWRPLDTSKESVVYTNWSESEIYKWVGEATNCNVTFVHPAAGQEQEKFNLMIASGDMTDIIERDFANTGNYPGGADKAIDDGVIIALNEAVENGWLPAMKAYFDADPTIWPQIMSDSGNILCVPFIREDPELWSSWGPQARMDWLEQLGWSADNLPNTIAEWDEVLRAMKSEGLCETPLLIVNLAGWGDNGSLPGAYGVGWEFYADESNTLQFGPAQDAFRDYLTQMRTWVVDGLVDPDWAAGVNTEQLRSKIMGNQVGVYFSNLGGGVGTWYDTINGQRGVVTAPEHPEGFQSTALPHPVLEEGQKSRFGGSALKAADMKAWISATCEDVQGACRYLDFGFTDEGKEVFNYGKEGVSFNYVNYKEANSPLDLSEFGDKFPMWDEHVHDPNDEFALSAILSKYIRAHSSMPGIQDKGYLAQFMQYHDQLNCINVWVASSDFTGQLLPRMYYTTEESDILASKQTDMLTYKNETVTKFLNGDLEINDANWAEFQANLEKMGLAEILEVRRAAHERAKNR